MPSIPERSPHGPRGLLSLLLAAVFLLGAPPQAAAAPAFELPPPSAPALGTLPALDSLDAWERLSFRLTVAEVTAPAAMAAVFIPLTVSFLAQGRPNENAGWNAFPILGSFGLGSLVVGIARGVNLGHYRRARAAARAAGDPWDPTDIAAVRRWQARENKAVGIGMLIDGLLTTGMAIGLAASRADNVDPTYARTVEITLAVGIAINFGAGTTQLAMGQRELTWLDLEGR